MSAEELLNAEQEPKTVLEGKQFSDKAILDQIIQRNDKFRLSVSVVAQSLYNVSEDAQSDASSSSDEDIGPT